jgi:bacteriocin biosynthesis cyclodehydratase domain-containing protein
LFTREVQHLKTIEALPRNPMLRVSCNLLPLDERGALAVSASTTLALRGGAVGELLPFLLSKLDGRRDLDQIVRELETFREEDVLAALRALWANGLLEDPLLDSIPPEDLELRDDEIRFFSGYGFERSPESYRRLRAARVVLLGGDATIREIARGLATSGVAEIRLGAPTHEDAAAAKRLETLNAELDELNCEGSHRTLRLSDDPSAADWTELLDGASFVIACANEWPAAFLEDFNRAALKGEIPWLYCLLEGRGASVGPLFLPRETACWSCYSRRRRGVEEFVAAYDAIQRSADREFRRRMGTAPGLSQFVAGLAVMEAVKFVTSFEIPASIGTELRFDLVSGRVEPHRVLKLPRCADCGPAALHAPRAAVWPSVLDGEV